MNPEISASKNTAEDLEKKYLDLNNKLQQEPKKAIDHIQEILKMNISPEIRLKFLLLLGNGLWILGKLQQAQQEFEKSLEQAGLQHNEEYIADALVGLGMVKNSKGELNDAADFFIRAISIYQKLELYEKEAHARNRYGINRSYLGKIQEGINSIEKAVELSQKVENLQIEISARNNLALFEMYQGDITKAAANFLQCTEISEKLANPRSNAVMLSNYAETQKDLGNYQLAEEKYFEALGIAEKSQNDLLIATIKSEIGGYFTDIGKFAEAKKFLDEGISLFSTAEMKFNYLQCLNNYAKYWLALGNYLKSIQYLQQALQIIEDTSLNFSKIQVLITLVRTHFALRNVDNAYTLIKEIMNLAWKQNNQVGLGLALIERARLNLSFSNFHEAELLLMESMEIGLHTNFFEIIVNSRMLLALTFLGKNEQHKYSQEIKTISNLINDVLKLTKDKEIWPQYVETLVVKAALYSFEGFNNEAQKVLNTAEELVDNFGLTGKTQQIYRIRSLVKKLNAQVQTGEREIILSQIYNLLMQEIQRITTSQGIYLELTAEDIEKVFMLSYKIDAKKGTVLHIAENVNPNDERLYNHIYLAGNIYMVSLGQGHGYHQGLFGPFPFADGGYRALVYSLTLKDEQNDKELDAKATFFITCLIYPQKLSPLLNSNEKLENIFYHHFKHILSVKTVTSSILANIRKEITDFFLKPFVVEHKQ